MTGPKQNRVARRARLSAPGQVQLQRACLTGIVCTPLPTRLSALSAGSGYRGSRCEPVGRDTGARFHREFGVADECPADAADWTGPAVTAEVAERLIGGRRRCSLHSLPLTRCEAETVTTKQVTTT